MLLPRVKRPPRAGAAMRRSCALYGLAFGGCSVKFCLAFLQGSACLRGGFAPLPHAISINPPAALALAARALLLGLQLKAFILVCVVSPSQYFFRLCNLGKEAAVACRPWVWVVLGQGERRVCCWPKPTGSPAKAPELPHRNSSW